MSIAHRQRALTQQYCSNKKLLKFTFQCIRELNKLCPHLSVSSSEIFYYYIKFTKQTWRLEQTKCNVNMQGLLGWPTSWKINTSEFSLIYFKNHLLLFGLRFTGIYCLASKLILKGSTIPHSQTVFPLVYHSSLPSQLYYCNDL